MAPIAARKARQILENVQKIIAIEFIYAAQAIDLRLKRHSQFEKEDMLGKGTRIAYQLIREYVDFLDSDRPLYPDIDKVFNLIKSEDIVKTIEKELGPL